MINIKVTTPKVSAKNKNIFKVKYTKCHGGDVGMDDCTDFLQEHELKALYILSKNQGDIKSVVPLIVDLFEKEDNATDFTLQYLDHYYYECIADIYDLRVTWFNEYGQEFNVTMEAA
jgi:hypothetical protein